ncbi:hypothetical protein MJL33_29015, partial [Salmonella enterica subsp. enterica serovar Kentucky]|nr:hypothetical protein [Salmonella enterica subsp. enterica serovar Kentucky]
NEGLIDNLPQGSCVEVACLVDANGIQPTKVGTIPSHLAAMMQLSGTRRTSGMRPLVEKICRKLCGPGKILSRRCIKERDATSGT